MMRRVGVVIGCLAFALAACGDGDDNTSAEDAIEEALEDVEGVGDGAYYVESVGAITVLVGDTVFTVQGVFLEIGTDTTVDQGDLQIRIIDLAEIVAGRV